MAKRGQNGAREGQSGAKPGLERAKLGSTGDDGASGGHWGGGGGTGIGDEAAAMSSAGCGDRARGWGKATPDSCVFTPKFAWCV